MNFARTHLAVGQSRAPFISPKDKRSLKEVETFRLLKKIPESGWGFARLLGYVSSKNTVLGHLQAAIFSGIPGHDCNTPT